LSSSEAYPGGTTGYEGYFIEAYGVDDVIAGWEEVGGVVGEGHFGELSKGILDRNPLFL